MNLHEYQAKELLKKYQVPVQEGIPVDQIGRIVSEALLVLPFSFIAAPFTDSAALAALARDIEARFGRWDRSASLKTESPGNGAATA